MSKLTWRWIAILVPVLLAVYFLYPTVQWYSMSQAQRESREGKRDPLLAKTINLGLDLKGGTHLVLEVQTEKIGISSEDKVATTDAIDRAIEVLRNRVDQFGVSEPLIARQGEKWIVVQLPGIKDPERAKQLIGKTALLEFHLVDDSSAMQTVMDALRDKNISFSSAVANHDALPQEIKDLYPAGYVLMEGREGRYYMVKSTPEMTGASLVDAKVQFGGGSTGFGYPEVSIEFNAEGAKQFSDVTASNINRSLAIVLDDLVQSAPVIRTRIPDGKAVIEGGFSAEEAKVLSTILRAGALPAPVEVIEERTVGPSLGEDSIRSGIFSSVAGLVLILLFMLVYYRGGGFVTDVSLLLNLGFLLASMIYFKATLTLPGIAGIILSLAMAVDANVLILERIREEIGLGKSPRLAVNQGYDKAFSTILDSNLTTLIAALFLFQFGTGPIKGFAVTLTIGIAVSMFTAIFVTRTYYEWRLQGKGMTSLSI